MECKNFIIVIRVNIQTSDILNTSSIQKLDIFVSGFQMAIQHLTFSLIFKCFTSLD
jgi:hypothetical protein